MGKLTDKLDDNGKKIKIPELSDLDAFQQTDVRPNNNLIKDMITQLPIEYKTVKTQLQKCHDSSDLEEFVGELLLLISQLLPLGWEKVVADKDDVARRIAEKEGQTVYRYYEKAGKAIAVSDLPADTTAKKRFLKTTALDKPEERCAHKYSSSIKENERLQCDIPRAWRDASAL